MNVFWLGTRAWWRTTKTTTANHPSDLSTRFYIAKSDCDFQCPSGPSETKLSWKPPLALIRSGMPFVPAKSGKTSNPLTSVVVRGERWTLKPWPSFRWLDGEMARRRRTSAAPSHQHVFSACRPHFRLTGEGGGGVMPSFLRVFFFEVLRWYLSAGTVYIESRCRRSIQSPFVSRSETEGGRGGGGSRATCAQCQVRLWCDIGRWLQTCL